VFTPQKLRDDGDNSPCGSNHFDGNSVPARLVSNNAKKMKSVGLIRFTLSDLPIDFLGSP